MAGPATTADRGGRAGGAFTLAEVLAVVVILGALAVVAAPLALSTGERAGWREAKRQVSVLVMLARSDSVRLGRAVTVWWEEEGGVCDVMAGEFGVAGEGTGVPGADPDGTGRRVARSLRLPPGVRLAATVDEEGEDGGAAIGGGTRGGGEFVLVTLLPEGSATRGGPCYMVGAGGRSAQARVNTWTGEVEFEEPGATDEAGGDEETPAGEARGEEDRR